MRVFFLITKKEVYKLIERCIQHSPSPIPKPSPVPFPNLHQSHSQTFTQSHSHIFILVCSTRARMHLALPSSLAGTTRREGREGRERQKGRSGMSAYFELVLHLICCIFPPLSLGQVWGARGGGRAWEERKSGRLKLQQYIN